MLTVMIWVGVGIFISFFTYLAIDLVRGLREKPKPLPPLPPHLPVLGPEQIGPAKWEAMMMKDIRNRRPAAIDPLKWEAAHSAQLAQMMARRRRHKPKKFQVEFLEE